MELNTNLNALRATNAIKSQSHAMDIATNRLSTGSKLDQSFENLAELLKSSKSLENKNALGQVIKASTDAVSLLQTAEGGLKDIQEILYRLKAISVQAASETYSSSDRIAINMETKFLLNQIDTTTSITEWNGRKLLEGAVTNETILTSANTNSSDNLSLTLANSTVTGLFDYIAPTFKNGDFTSGTDNWDVVAGQLKLGQNGVAGETTVAGFPSAIDASPTASTGGQTSRGDDFAPSSASYNSDLVNGALRLYSNMTTSAGGDIVHGPYIVSNDSVYIQSGRSVSFDWRAQGGSDAYDVYAYVLNTDTGETIELLNETGSGTADSGWQTQVREIQTSGNYKFIFSSGTFDETFGMAAGASLYLDNIKVTGENTYVSDYGQVLSNLDTASANVSITKIDSALEKVIDQRSHIGAHLGRLENSINYVSTLFSSFSADLNRLENADYAAESTALAKSRILHEAGMAVLTLSKASPKIVLDLLKK